MVIAYVPISMFFAGPVLIALAVPMLKHLAVPMSRVEAEPMLIGSAVNRLNDLALYMLIASPCKQF